MREADELTEAERRFEDALKSLRPAHARIDAARAAAAARHRRARRRRRMWQAAAAAVVMAAGGAWLAFGPRQPSTKDGQHVAAVKLAAPEAEPPTLLTYRRALGRSPAELDALLDEQVSGGGASDDSLTFVGVLAL
jgi:hypothetical protein